MSHVARLAALVPAAVILLACGDGDPFRLASASGEAGSGPALDGAAAGKSSGAGGAHDVQGSGGAGGVAASGGGAGGGSAGASQGGAGGAGSGGGAGKGGAATVCSPGTATPCDCPGLPPGTQVCKADGSGYTECACPTPPAVVVPPLPMTCEMWGMTHPGQAPVTVPDGGCGARHCYAFGVIDGSASFYADFFLKFCSKGGQYSGNVYRACCDPESTWPPH